MNVNGIPCGGYSVSNNKVNFSLYDTNYDEVSTLNKQQLILTITDGDTVIFDGYSIAEVSVGEDAIRVGFVKDLDEATKNSINALEENFMQLHNLVSANQASVDTNLSVMSNAISPMIMRENLTDAEALVCKKFYPEWKIDFNYKKDWIVRYENNLYRIGQDHTSQEQWIPGSDGTTALYSKIEIEEGFEVWKEWDGVSGSYAKDQIVKDPTDNNLYKSKIDSNVWGPPSEQPDYWELYESA